MSVLLRLPQHLDHMFSLQDSIPLVGTTYDETMKNLKSRTVVGRTLARVKSRIASFGSLATPPAPGSPPLLATPRPAYPTIRLIEAAHNTRRPPSPAKQLKNEKGKEASEEDSLLPHIATLQITSSTWTVLANPAYPKYAATAYVQFTINCKSANAAQSGTSPAASVSSLISPRNTSTLAINKSQNPPGLLLNLSLTLTTTGPATTVQTFGDTSIPCLSPDGTWLYVLHLGIRDTSLASKLTTSWKSLRKKASKSLKRYNMETIDRWLDVLTADKSAERAAEQVVVKVKVRYQHSFLAHGKDGTWLEDVKECRVNTNECCGVGFDGASDRRTSEEENETDLMEEMVREHNVALGPPFML